YALVYRQDIADAAGVTAPTTWEEMVPFLEGLQSAGAVKGFGADVGWDVYSGQNLTQYVWQAGGDVMNSDGTEWTLDTPEMVAAMEYVKNFFDTGVADIGGPGFLDTQSYFVEGKTAAMITGPWVIGQFDAVAGEDGWTAENVGTVPVPGGAGGNIETIAGGSLGVLTDSDNQENAWKVIRYLAEPDTQVAQYDAYASLPAVQSAWEDPAIADEPLLDAYFEQLQNTKAYPQNSTWIEVATQMGAEIEAVAKGTETPEDAAASLQSFAENLGTGE
ncbi:MAG: putative transporter-binding protein, partial [Glaciihabitans sp.]|nr:putative transporter-binding protein [Glaciihabitans sp.]